MVDRPLRPGDEVVVPATSFPTTVAPIIQNGLVPVYVDCEIGTYNADLDEVERAVSASTKVRAIALSHTLGNVFDLDRVVELCRRQSLYLVEDCCDALGSRWKGRSVGTFGDFASLSFYPSHHITTGEGGAALTNKAKFGRAARTMRDWGRDCWCPTGVSNTCGKRFDWQLGDLPKGYDHKYIYATVGYNLKPTDLQASIGLVQIDRLPGFIEKRKRNFASLFGTLSTLPWLTLPHFDAKADVSWFAFPITVDRDAPFRRSELVAHLEEKKIDTRGLFAGNIVRQPGYWATRHRVFGSLERSDHVMNSTFMVGLHPGITEEMIDYMTRTIRDFVLKRWTAS
jgi:CDP-6-deoxy-D-xylo-4-hexulose-3-dehydrase